MSPSDPKLIPDSKAKTDLPGRCRLLPILGLLWLPTGPLHAQDAPRPWSEVRLQSSELTESSGLAVCQHDPDLVWTHNDSGGKPRLYLFDRRQGALRGVFELSGLQAVDWEDMCAFEFGGRRFLAIGDVGDNQRRRKQVAIHIVEEPVPPPASLYSTGELLGRDLPNAPGPVVLPIRQRLTLEVTYPDGAVDCESLAYDPQNSRFLLLSKELFRCRVFEVKWDTSQLPSTRAAQANATIPCSAADLQTLKIPLATAADLCPESHRLVICTYGPAYLLERDDQGWSQQSMRRIQLPKRRQGEAIAFAGADNLVVSSEFSPAPLWTVPIVLESLENQNDGSQ